MGNWGTKPCDSGTGINGFGPSEHKNNKYYKKIITFRDGYRNTKAFYFSNKKTNLYVD